MMISYYFNRIISYILSPVKTFISIANEDILQTNTKHFHKYYVIRFMKDGARALICRDKTYTIAKKAMLELAEKITGRWELPGFSRNVIFDEEVGCSLRSLREMVMSGFHSFGKKEGLLLLSVF